MQGERDQRFTAKAPDSLQGRLAGDGVIDGGGQTIQIRGGRETVAADLFYEGREMEYDKTE